MCFGVASHMILNRSQVISIKSEIHIPVLFMFILLNIVSFDLLRRWGIELRHEFINCSTRHF
jgi:hypothetical protein